MRCNLPFALLAALACGSVSCRRAELSSLAKVEMERPNAVATVSGTTITAEAFQAELQRQIRNVPKGGLTLEKKLAALDGLIRTEAAYQKALAAGFDRQPDVQARIKSLIVAQFRERHARPSQPPTVTEAETQSAYETQKERFQVPEAVRGAVIFVEAPRTATPEKQAELRQRAEAVWSEARAAADDRAFAQVAARHSEDRPTRYRGGDTGWLGRDGAGYDPALAEALLKLAKPGEFAPLVVTSRGFYIAKLVEKREAGHKPAGEVKEALRYQITRQKAEQAERDFYTAMKAGLDIQINRELLESISLPVDAPEPPGLPGSTTAQLR